DNAPARKGRGRLGTALCLARRVTFLSAKRTRGPVVINGTVNPRREPVVELPVAGQRWTAVIDTGFNGDLELPHALFAALQPVFSTRGYSQLAAGQFVQEDIY